MTRSHPKTPARRLALEPLDRRDLPDGSGTAIPWGVTVNSFGALRIKGAGYDDVASVTIENGQVRAVLKHWSEPTPNLPNGVLVNDQDKSFPVAQVKSVSFYGLDGDDGFTNHTGIKSTAHGYAGSDTLVGGSAADILLGWDGADTLEGRGGDDDLRGGVGSDDYVFAPLPAFARRGLGADKVVEAAYLDADRLDFSALAGGIKVFLKTTFAQSVKSGYLSLTLSNAEGVENVSGTPGPDWVGGNNRPNTVVGFDGNDTMFGIGGPDFLSGGAGGDSLDGGSGDDIAWGGDDSDRLFGDWGNDRLAGDSGNDTMDGGRGGDTLGGGDGNDSMRGGPAWGTDILDGGAGNDTLEGGDGPDALYGRDGNDALDGGDRRDTLDGGAGFDRLRADQGDETLSNGERVEIAVPGGSVTETGWSDGPMAASRLLRSYLIGSATYSALKSDAQGSTIISQYGGVGTPPPVLRDIMQEYKSDIHLASGASFQSVLDRLGEGRPVVALLGWGEVEVPVPYPWDPANTDIAPFALTYVCLTGFDLSSNTIFYRDMFGDALSMSFSEFQEKWNWPADGAVYGFLSAKGVKKQTMLW